MFTIVADKKKLYARKPTQFPAPSENNEIDYLIEYFDDDLDQGKLYWGSYNLHLSDLRTVGLDGSIGIGTLIKSEAWCQL